MRLSITASRHIDRLMACVSQAMFRLAAAVLALAIPGVATAQEADTLAIGSEVPSDRWLEMDLYWFDPEAVDDSAQQFWDRYAPLYRDLNGYRGVVLTVGGTVDYIMLFSGDLEQAISLPSGTGMELDEPVVGDLDGDTTARQLAWRARFANPAHASSENAYGHWTYARLAALTRALREAGRAHGVDDFRIGTNVVGVNNMYGETAAFARAHPEAWTRWGEVEAFMDNRAFFDPGNSLTGDDAAYAAFPGGIPDGTMVHAAFGAQWGEF